MYIELASGAAWRFSGGDASTSMLIDDLGSVFSGDDSAVELAADRLAEPASAEAMPGTLGAAHLARKLNGATKHFLISPDGTHPFRLRQGIVQLMSFGEVTRGGFPLHGALADRLGQGVVLAGPGGTGKSTASARLPNPWESLSDDTTLIVENGSYRAHPWPNPASVLGVEGRRRIDVKRVTAARAVFFLSQAEEDAVQPLRQAEAACALLESFRQAAAIPGDLRHDPDLRWLCETAMDNICRFAKETPAYRLRLSLTGRFWEMIGKVLDEQ